MFSGYKPVNPSANSCSQITSIVKAAQACGHQALQSHSHLEARLVVSPQDQAVFAQALQAHWPSLDAQRLQAAYAGMRANIGGSDMRSPDFLIQDASSYGLPDLVNLFDLESPGLTSCLAIAQAVAKAAAAQLKAA